MAHVIKSDLTVNNPDIEFDYLTPLGTASKELAQYVMKLDQMGYNMTQGEFNALKQYYNEMKAIGQWENLQEVAPLIGSTIDQISVKLKYKNAQSCIKKNGISNAFTDAKGLYVATRAATAPPALDLVYTTQDSIDAGGAGVIAYAKSTGVFPSGNYKAICGGFYGLEEKFNGENDLQHKYLNSTLNTTAIGNMFMLSTKYPISGGSIVGRKIYKDGVLFNSSATPVVISTQPDTALSHWVGAVSNATTGLYGFEGNIRFVAIHNGLIPDALMPTVSDLTSALMVGLGKEF